MLLKDLEIAQTVFDELRADQLARIVPEGPVSSENTYMFMLVLDSYFSN